MTNKKIGALFAAATIALTITLAGCSSDSSTSSADAGATTSETVNVVVEKPDTPVRVDVTEFSSIVTAPGVQIIDVRTPEEFAQGHIEGAVNFNVEGPDFATQVAGLDPAGTYAVYCRSGNRSQPAVGYMAQQGITGIYELESGTVGWDEAGLPLVS
jgi:phage shock protein E